MQDSRAAECAPSAAGGAEAEEVHHGWSDRRLEWSRRGGGYRSARVCTVVRCANCTASLIPTKTMMSRSAGAMEKEEADHVNYRLAKSLRFLLRGYVSWDVGGVDMILLLDLRNEIPHLYNPDDLD